MPPSPTPFVEPPAIGLVANEVHTVAATAGALSTLTCRSAILYFPAANVGSVYLGGPGVTTATGIPYAAGSYLPIGFVDLSSMYTIGTAGDKVRILQVLA